MNSKPPFWFPAKRYGWGWGVPVRWQGWVVAVGYVVLMLATVILAPPARSPGLFLGAIAVLTAALLAICWAKGEPPRWRWGDRDRE